MRRRYLLSETRNEPAGAPAAGTLPGTWGAGDATNSLNEAFIQRVELDLGGLNTTLLSASPVNITADQGRCLIQRLTGTLLADVPVTSPNVGFNVYENATTGSFKVTVQFTGGVGSTTVVPQGGAVLVIADGTKGVRAATNAVAKALIAASDLTRSTITSDQNKLRPDRSHGCIQDPFGLGCGALDHGPRGRYAGADRGVRQRWLQRHPDHQRGRGVDGSQPVVIGSQGPSSECLLTSRFRTKSLHREYGKEVPLFRRE